MIEFIKWANERLQPSCRYCSNNSNRIYRDDVEPDIDIYVCEKHKDIPEMLWYPIGDVIYKAYNNISYRYTPLNVIEKLLQLPEKEWICKKEAIEIIGLKKDLDIFSKNKIIKKRKIKGKNYYYWNRK